MLAPETDRVWQFLKEQEALAGFVLVGGSGLSLRINHRISEDLDFAFFGDRLPRQRLDGLMAASANGALHFERNDDAAALNEFSLGGIEIHDYQQDFLVNDRVKVSFFVPAPALLNVLASGDTSGPRIATLDELFKAKCLVSSRRSKTRDWLDLFLLLRMHGYAAQDYRNAFLEAKDEPNCDIGLTRLCSGIPQRDDEGYAHLMENAPSLDEMKASFVKMRDEIEIGRAAEAATRRAGGEKSSVPSVEKS
ncbi:MAG: nucleotidyl transferase AbiEii/AbiGii toxin family protein [Verrucomicrobia bacterium]|nr:nucleotidyl transferase AbiEii/AbiGii toxin family protein [Verrucomicrobiota bacterium]